jgi:hypothetical protein
MRHAPCVMRHAPCAMQQAAISSRLSGIGQKPAADGRAGSVSPPRSEATLGGVRRSRDGHLLGAGNLVGTNHRLSRASRPCARSRRS